MSAATTVVSTKTQVFTNDELKALRRALNKGVNGSGSYNAPPQEDQEESDDWRNDISLLVKFLNDLRSILSALITTRLPPHHRKRFNDILTNLQPNIDQAVGELEKIDG